MQQAALADATAALDAARREVQQLEKRAGDAEAALRRRDRELEAARADSEHTVRLLQDRLAAARAATHADGDSLAGPQHLREQLSSVLHDLDASKVGGSGGLLAPPSSARRGPGGPLQAGPHSPLLHAHGRALDRSELGDRSGFAQPDFSSGPGTPGGGGSGFAFPPPLPAAGYGDRQRLAGDLEQSRRALEQHKRDVGVLRGEVEEARRLRCVVTVPPFPSASHTRVACRVVWALEGRRQLRVTCPSRREQSRRGGGTGAAGGRGG